MDARVAINQLLDDSETRLYGHVSTDRGGPTHSGITQKTYDNWRLAYGLPMRSVQYLTPEEMYAIYTYEYWFPAGGGRLPDGLDYAVFQAGVNFGPPQGVKMLQKVLGVTQDGIVGPKTLAAVAAVDKTALIAAFFEEQKARYNLFVQNNPDQIVNLKGWNNRIALAAQFIASHKRTIGLGLALVVTALLVTQNLKTNGAYHGSFI